MKCEVWTVKCDVWTVKYEVWIEVCPNLNGASLHRAFYVHPSIVLIWLKYSTVELDVKPQIIHPWIVNFEMALSVVFYT